MRPCSLLSGMQATPSPQGRDPQVRKNVTPPGGTPMTLLGLGLLSPLRTRGAWGCRFLQDRVCWWENILNTLPKHITHWGVQILCCSKVLVPVCSEVSPRPPSSSPARAEIGAPLTRGAALTLYCESSQLVPWALRKANCLGRIRWSARRMFSPYIHRVNPPRVENT